MEQEVVPTLPLMGYMGSVATTGGHRKNEILADYKSSIFP